MYNIYQYQKEIKEKNTIEAKLIHNKIHKLHKNIRERKMINNYEKKLSHFAYSMAENNFKINKVSNTNINNTRLEYMKENSNKILSNKGMVFKEFSTEQQRAQRLAQENSVLEKFYKWNKEQYYRQQKIKEKNSNKRDQFRNIMRSQSMNSTGVGFNNNSSSNKNNESNHSNNTAANISNDKEVEENDEMAKSMTYFMWKFKKMKNADKEIRSNIGSTGNADNTGNNENNMNNDNKKNNNNPNNQNNNILMNDIDDDSKIKHNTHNKHYFKGLAHMALNKSFYNNKFINQNQGQKKFQDRRNNNPPNNPHNNNSNNNPNILIESLTNNDPMNKTSNNSNRKIKTKCAHFQSDVDKTVNFFKQCNKNVYSTYNKHHMNNDTSRANQMADNIFPKSVRLNYSKINNKNNKGMHSLTTNKRGSNIGNNRNNYGDSNIVDVETKSNISNNNFFDNNPNNFNNDNIHSHLTNKKYKSYTRKFSLNEQNLGLIESNPLLYNIEFNPLKKAQDDKLINFEQLKLSKMILSDSIKPIGDDKGYAKQRNKKKYQDFLTKLKDRKSKSTSKISSDPNFYFIKFRLKEESRLEHLVGEHVDENNPDKKLEDNDDKIYIQGEMYDKHDLVEISKKILKKTMYTNQKSNNSKTSLNKGSGKLAITNGMSILEFKAKYNV